MAMPWLPSKAVFKVLFVGLISLAFANLTDLRETRAATPADAWKAYGGGVNILGYDPLWSDPAKARFQWSMFKTIRDGGFRHVRVNLQAFTHMDGQNRLDPKWLDTLDTVVKKATDAGLDVILDEHDYRPCGADADVCRTKILAFWEQVAPRFKNAPSSVMFEILNEPNRAMDAARWNSLLAEALTTIRQTNPVRTVIVGPANSNNLKALPQLKLPDNDRNLLVTVHYYNPSAFTHQGATWTTPSREHLTGVPWGTSADHAAVDKDFDIIAAWAKANHRPILIGEFGAYDKGEMSMRAAWASAVAKAAEARGFAWTWWQFESSFSIYDMKRQQWIAPLKQAIMPEGR